MSKGYLLASEKPHPFEIVGPAPAGALSSPGEDMAHFMIAHLQNGEYNGNRILRPETAEMMHNSPLTLLPPLNRMELGFFETNINGREVIAHLGDTQNFHTSLHLFLKEGVGFYVSFNSLGKAGAAGGLRAAMFEDFADRYFPGGEKEHLVDAKTAARHAAMLKGNWANSRGSQSNFISLLYFVGQTKVGVNAKGELVTPFLGLNGKPLQWVETDPFLWRATGSSHERLAAQVVDDKVVRFSIDGISPFMVFGRAPWYQNAAWLLPLLCVVLAALVLTALTWPIAAIVRRRYGARLEFDLQSLRAYRLSKIAAILILAAVGTWALTLTKMLSDVNNLSAKFDAIVRFAQIFGIVVFIGGLAVMVWHLRVVWSGNRRWPARVWSLVLAVSAFFVLWAAIVLKLIGFGLSY
jgi:hypothetical protein